MNSRIAAVSIIAFALLQTPFLFTPPDHSHTWRQCDTAAIARNYYEEDNQIFFPRIDVRGGETDGVTGMEFPFYSYLVYLSYEILGFHHGIGKGVSLVFALASLVLCRLWVRGIAGHMLADVATVTLASSTLFFAYASKTLPEMTALCLHFAALVCFQRAIPDTNTPPRCYL
ncbi:MAG: glycosyltransferase family 39 protein [Nitrospinae bacterium]|nr:glycosyltransferase family 39 protein [Nitrospinota bacterium]